MIKPSKSSECIVLIIFTIMFDQASAGSIQWNKKTYSSKYMHNSKCKHALLSSLCIYFCLVQWCAYFKILILEDDKSVGGLELNVLFEYLCINYVCHIIVSHSQIFYAALPSASKDFADGARHQSLAGVASSQEATNSCNAHGLTTTNYFAMTT